MQWKKLLLYTNFHMLEKEMNHYDIRWSDLIMHRNAYRLSMFATAQRNTACWVTRVLFGRTVTITDDRMSSACISMFRMLSAITANTIVTTCLTTVNSIVTLRCWLVVLVAPRPLTGDLGYQAWYHFPRWNRKMRRVTCCWKIHHKNSAEKKQTEKRQFWISFLKLGP